MLTPWGLSDYQEDIAPGMTLYGTPSHGGIKLSPELNKAVHPALRNEDGWYEEDCEILKVIYSFPMFFPEHNYERTILGLRHWFTEAFAIAERSKH